MLFSSSGNQAEKLVLNEGGDHLALRLNNKALEPVTLRLKTLTIRRSHIYTSDFFSSHVGINIDKSGTSLQNGLHIWITAKAF